MNTFVPGIHNDNVQIKFEKKNTQRKEKCSAVMLSDFFIVMLSVVMLNVVMPTVVAPVNHPMVIMIDGFNVSIKCQFNQGTLTEGEGSVPMTSLY